MQIRFGYKTNIGTYRSNNQDYFDFVNNSFNNYIAIICDGMGGHKHGEIASKMVVNSLVGYFKLINFNNLSDKEINKWFHKIILKIQQEMIDYSKIYPNTSDMGTTVVAALITNKKIYVINIGDSRLYKLYNDKIYQITTDQNIKNSIKYSEKKELEFKCQYIKKYNIHNFWKVLTSALGPTKNFKIDTYIIKNIKGQYLLITDGIYNYVDKIDLVKTLKSKNKLNDKIKILIDLAIENLSTDNLTGIIFEITD